MTLFERFFKSSSCGCKKTRKQGKKQGKKQRKSKKSKNKRGGYEYSQGKTTGSTSKSQHSKIQHSKSQGTAY